MCSVPMTLRIICYYSFSNNSLWFFYLFYLFVYCQGLCLLTTPSDQSDPRIPQHCAKKHINNSTFTSHRIAKYSFYFGNIPAIVFPRSMHLSNKASLFSLIRTGAAVTLCYVDGNFLLVHFSDVMWKKLLKATCWIQNDLISDSHL